MTEELTWATCQPWETLTASEKAASLIEELEATAERLTQHSNSPLDGLLHEAANVLRELTAAPAQPDPLHVANERGEGWQPIETAPKTNRSILVWCPERRNIFQVCWGGFDGWLYFGPFTHSVYENPTHWMPLPAPPAAPKEKP